MRRKQSSLVISELVSANGIEYAGQKTLELLKFHDEERTVGLQIFGEDEEILCKGAKVVENLGADFVDLNLGCPVPKIVKKGAGSAMCRNPPALGQILSAMVKSVKIPVTIKIRTGWDENSKNALEVVHAAADAGVSWVAIHGRTRAQGYSGKADWDFIGDIKAKSPLPIIGNGDVMTAEDAVSKYRTYGVDGVMIGRGALRNPFLFEQCLALLSGEEKEFRGRTAYLDLLDEKRLLLEENFNPKMAMLQARKFLAWYSAGFPGCHNFRSQVFSIQEPDDLWNEAHSFFTKAFPDSPSARDLEFMQEPFLMGGHG